MRDSAHTQAALNQTKTFSNATDGAGVRTFARQSQAELTAESTSAEARVKNLQAAAGGEVSTSGGGVKSPPEGTVSDGQFDAALGSVSQSKQLSGDSAGVPSWKTRAESVEADASLETVAAVGKLAARSGNDFSETGPVNASKSAETAAIQAGGLAKPETRQLQLDARSTGTEGSAILSSSAKVLASAAKANSATSVSAGGISHTSSEAVGADHGASVSDGPELGTASSGNLVLAQSQVPTGANSVTLGSTKTESGLSAASSDSPVSLNPGKRFQDGQEVKTLNTSDLIARRDDAVSGDKSNSGANAVSRRSATAKSDKGAVSGSLGKTGQKTESAKSLSEAAPPASSAALVAQQNFAVLPDAFSQQGIALADARTAGNESATIAGRSPTASVRSGPQTLTAIESSSHPSLAHAGVSVTSEDAAETTGTASTLDSDNPIKTAAKTDTQTKAGGGANTPIAGITPEAIHSPTTQSHATGPIGTNAGVHGLPTIASSNLLAETIKSGQGVGSNAQVISGRRSASLGKETGVHGSSTVETRVPADDKQADSARTQDAPKNAGDGSEPSLQTGSVAGHLKGSSEQAKATKDPVGADSAAPPVDTSATSLIHAASSDVASANGVPGAPFGHIGGNASGVVSGGVPAASTPEQGVSQVSKSGNSLSATASLQARNAGNPLEISSGLDATGSIGGHRALLATPTTLEVGVPDGTQGWLKIRAEVGDQGQVNASLAAGSSAGQEMLHRELPALNAYLHSEQMRVTATVSERSFAASGGFESNMSNDAGTGSQANGGLTHGGAGGQQGEAAQAHVTLGQDRGREGDAAPTYDASAGLSGTNVANSALGNRALTNMDLEGSSGQWLNVRA